MTVTQEPFLFSDTVRANVAFGVEEAGAGGGDVRGEGAGGREPEVAGTGVDAPAASVERAVADAALGPDLARMPAGLETLVGERGITLSGGQKQRVALARAMRKPCSLLILDDVLSAVDHDTERLLVDRIHALTEARSLLVVSHRISVLERADRVIVLDRGRVVDEGRHHELAVREGPYREAWRRQADETARRRGDDETAPGREAGGSGKAERAKADGSGAAEAFGNTAAAATAAAAAGPVVPAVPAVPGAANPAATGADGEVIR